jgi:Trypsin-co-occurring domain 2
MSNEIGLAELIAQVKKELAVKLDDSPVFWVEKVELELNVTVKREAKGEVKGGLKVLVLSIVEASTGGTISREDVHKIKLTLGPLISKDDIISKMSPDEKEKAKDISPLVQGGGGIRS